MNGGHWWDTRPGERIFMEITRREDLGSDLLAPVSARGGASTASYALVPTVRAGDIVVHYDSASEEIAGVSLAASDPEPTSLYWVARGASARKAGAKAQWVQGVRVPLDKYTALSPPLSLADLRSEEAAVMAVRAQLQKDFGDAPLYFPWVPYAGQSMRTFQSYLVKLPREVVELFPTLSSAIASVEPGAVGPFDATPETVVAEAEIASAAGRGRKGQGFQLDQKVKVAVEIRAMNAATDHFGQHFEVEDVHGNQSFDLVCRAPGVEKRVEVKGTTTSGAEVLLTPNEVDHARTYKDVALFVLADIQVERHEDGSVTASGGTATIFDPWDITAGTLKPVGYRFAPLGSGPSQP